MNSRSLFRTGIIGAILAALCCSTPILGIALGAIGRSALATKANYVLIPVLVGSLGLVWIGLYRHNASTPAVIDWCKTDKNKGKFKRSEEHTSELQSLMRISYAVFCLKKKNTYIQNYHILTKCV